MSPSTPIRLVALDLDGTLLDSKSQISPRTRQAIADAVGRGVIVLPCTGRPLASLPPLVAQLPGIRYAITTNGAAVWDMGTDPLGAVYSRYADAARRQTHQPVRLLHRPMPPETAREAFALYQEYHGPLSIFSDGCAYLDAYRVWSCFRARKNRHLSTEARQPDDGRYHVVRDQPEWLSRHAHEVEKFCMFFDSIGDRAGSSPPLPGPAGRGSRAGCRRTTWRSPPRAWTKARPCWHLADHAGHPAGSHRLPSATVKTTVPCWPGPVWPL